ncbi:probable cytochrome P450 6v1 [Drosophila nasuta]|uniref:Probable cytochrome P450 6v1 n=1 Tax=Drosophila albomicans TaxID=7291 RepID=A0A6P8XW92_DROAB|nr:probable cytochrome P450 6v1 [Drosophila albomicans]XP_034117688.1 probable cytochrome P450 6v1 [Drosophila albomicans]XP_034117697.1 probable cytochrome P450 6v1 [Drosophila albomicans]XP_060663193.1 probable cytochrome P450 6v1 [Drosophila nasuta]XP_060663194.1 probable cytochrome P450 6v1 [Drosophila nasuta]XP_060663195.1 probable cytochrome P450 6v1 [Drosophila nasuta]
MVYSTNILLAIVTILTAVFIWSRRTYVYWQRRRVKFVQPTHILGNLKKVLKLEESFALQLRRFYFDDRFRNEPVVGIYLFHQPALLIRDLQLVRTVLVEDFVSFSNRFAKCDMRHDKMGSLNLFFARQPEWREIRTRLSPVFTGAKIKQMFSLMEEIGCDLEWYLKRLTRDLRRGDAARGVIVSIKDVCDLYNTDMIASIAFGLRSYSLRNTQSEIGSHCQDIFKPNVRRIIDFFVIFFLPKLVPLFRSKLFTEPHSEFLRRVIQLVIEERERGGILRNDLIEMLLTLKKEADLQQDKSHFTHHQDFLAAQAASFEVAGIETCSSTMSFALYELAKQPLMQERLRREIRHAFAIAAAHGSHGAGPGLSYELIAGMKYLDMVVEETLRMYPIVPLLERECTPINKKRFYSLRPHAECYARRGMPVFISNLAIHHDSKYWPEPERFDPERFNAENKSNQTPMSYLPFGAGPHHCIGLQIALLQIKLGLIYFLRQHRVEFCDQTVDHISFDAKFALLASEHSIYLKVVDCL